MPEYSEHSTFDLSEAPPAVSQPDKADPTLQKNLANGLDEGVVEVREKAIEKLTNADNLLGFWIQVIGDGTRLSGAYDSYIERLTPLRVAFATSVSTDLDFSERAMVTGTLFDQHFSLQTDPSGYPDISDQRLYEHEMKGLVEAVEDRYGAVDDPDFLGSGNEEESFEYGRERAASILDSDRISYLWVQLVMDDSSWFKAGIRKHLLSSDAPFDSLNWFRGVDPRLRESSVEPYVTPALMAQHLYVAAKTIPASPAQVGQNTLSTDPNIY